MRDKVREERMAERRLSKEKKMEQRRMELELAREMKRPAEDLELDDLQVSLTDRLVISLQNSTGEISPGISV